MPEPETFESEEEFDEEEAPAYEPPRRGRKRVESVPDAPVENAEDLPLLTFAGTGKANTVTYLKVTRLDGGKGERGIKGKLDPTSTVEDVARRFGNGTYNIEGCNYKHKCLARQEVEISIPGFDEDPTPAQQPVSGPSPNFALHQMKMIADMSADHSATVKDQAGATATQVQAMASKTMEMLTAFTTAQRESERSAYAAAQQNQQTFFASMMAMQNTAHTQQMEMLTAMNERGRKDQLDPMAMIQVFMDGIKAAGELGGGEGTEPWVQALKEGTGMMGHLAQLAQAPGVQNALPGKAPQLPATTVERPARDAQAPGVRKKKLPFKKTEIRGMAQLRAQLRRRGISFEDFLAQTTDYYQQVPDSELYDAGDDGPVESEHAAQSPQHSAPAQAGPTDPSD